MKLSGTGQTGVQRKVPDISGHAGGAGRGIVSGQHGVHRKRPRAHREGGVLPGVNGGPAGECDLRREWLIDWMQRLRDRLRMVRVCCGDWKRVCSSFSVTTRLGMTGVFLDPPYRLKTASGEASRSNGLYANDGEHVNDLVDGVIDWCKQWGPDPLMRIAVCGYEGEGYESLGWDEVAWSAQGGYGNRGGGNANRDRERIWFSPGCVAPDTMSQPTLWEEGGP